VARRQLSVIDCGVLANRATCVISSPKRFFMNSMEKMLGEGRRQGVL